jgi:hypothetical protein
MQEITDKISREDKLCYIMGDLDIDLLKYNNKRIPQQYDNSRLSPAHNKAHTCY